MSNERKFDVVIVGGGPAGMQAALVLSRTRKRIVVFDDPQPPRNAASHGVHNFLGMDGLLPSEIRKLAWEQIDRYGSAELCYERIEDIRRDENGGFLVTSQTGQTSTARHVILAFGYHDVHPNIPGFSECWGSTIIPCPFCDGYENRDRVWGIVVSWEMELQHFPKMTRNWTSRRKVILPRDMDVEPAYEQELTESGVSFHRGQIVEIHHTGGEVEGVTLDTGERVEVGTLLWTPPEKPSPLVGNLVENLGLELDEYGYVAANKMQETNVKGLWAAGDVQGWSGALEAANAGSMAAAMIVRGWYGS